MSKSNNHSPHQYEKKNIWEVSKKEEISDIFLESDKYKIFLDAVRTEREGVEWVQAHVEAKGFVNLETVTSIKPGDKVFYQFENKNITLAIIGTDSIKNGVNIIGAHLDAPRLDLKVRPLIEENGVAMLKTHYYGGIKKYQWLNIPLAIHGVIIKQDGTKVTINIGDKDEDPVFVISDLLPHLSRKIQGDKKLLDGIDGENLNIFVGTMPIENKDYKDRVKAFVLEYLFNTYGIIEEDFISAELEVVPALKTKDVGFDRSMIGGYAHDDRVCSYSALNALIQMESTPKKTAIVFLTDKEEIGSKGITGSDSQALPNIIAELLYREDKQYHDIELRRLLNRSCCLSADVGAALNPLFPSVHDKHNASFMGSGVIIKKYTGAGGKSGASDASAELVAKIRRIFNENDVVWQASSMGKIDEGGGGTIAMFIAQYGIPVMDCGIGVVGMHAPYELISKADLYHLIKGYKAFFINA